MLRTIAVVLALAGAAHAERPSPPVIVSRGSIAMSRTPRRSVRRRARSRAGIRSGTPIQVYRCGCGARACQRSSRSISRCSHRARPSDFVVASNTVTGAIRTVGFEQTAHGLRVLGGSIAVTFERDQLVMVGSTALPSIAVRMPTGMLAAVARRGVVDRARSCCRSQRCVSCCVPDDDEADSSLRDARVSLT